MDDHALPAWFDAADAAVVALQRGDPTWVFHEGHEGPREWVHGEARLVWAARLVGDAGHSHDSDDSGGGGVRLDALLLTAVRAAHIGRYRSPRAAAAAGRAGYLRWRRDLYATQGATIRRILADSGAPEEVCTRAELLVSKQLLGSDPDAGLIEDTLALVFFQLDASDLARRLDLPRTQRAVERTCLKMTPAGRALLARAARRGEFDPAVEALLSQIRGELA